MRLGIRSPDSLRAEMFRIRYISARAAKNAQPRCATRTPKKHRRARGERRKRENKKYGKLNNSDSVGMRAEKQFINIA